MLKSLMIRDFAIIDEVHIEFSSGMSVLTGETGAGKSIIIDAISLLMGARATSYMVKSGAKKALIEGIFTLEAHSVLKRRLEEFGFDCEDQEMVISREISAEGKSTARVNYRHASVALLKELGQSIADIHSQFETQYLLNDKIHLSLLDRYIQQPMTDLQKLYQSAYQDYVQTKKDYETLLNTPSDEEQLEFYRTRIQEIADADLQEGEIEELENEKKRMGEYEKINQKLRQTLHFLKDDQMAVDCLYDADHAFSQIEDETLTEMQEHLSSLYYQVSDICDEIENYQDSLVFDEYRYEEIQNRLFLIRKLQRQYGYEVEDILQQKQEYEKKIELIENREEMLTISHNRLVDQREKTKQIALKIRQLRHSQAKELEKQISNVLKDLFMKNTKFVCQFNELAEPTSNGMDEMSFMISTNVGQELQKLSDVASGGELSRLMLGLKCIFTQLEGVSTIIFDEVDTGVSGKVAFAIGRKMKEIAFGAQVICITHLPQVASFASHHLFVYKKITNGTTQTFVKWLDEEERVEEIAKMLSNDTVNQSALENARYLLNENGKN